MTNLRGFESLRTRRSEQMPEKDTRRRCTVCGAFLREGNPTDTCATQRCSGVQVAPLADWEEAIIDTDGLHGVELVAKMRGFEHRGQIERNREILRLHNKGYTRTNLSELFGVSRATINEIIWRAKQKEMEK